MSGVSSISIIWFLFAAVFFYLAYVHWRYSQTPIRPFRLRQKGGPGTEGQAPQEDPHLKEFIEDFNQYLQIINSNTKQQNQAAFGGYLVAGLVALTTLGLIVVR